MAPVLPGSVIADRYQIETVLGQGGSGTVYRAWDRMLGELVAVKVLHPQRALEKSWIRRLAREVKVARAIRHPNVCRVFELGQDHGRWFVTMELATGGSLRDLLRAGKPTAPAPGGAPHATSSSALPAAGKPATAPERRPLAERIADVRALCAGLAAIHAVGITHRDVTPQNVLRMADGRLVLTDFGLAIEHDDQTTVHGGTPAYLPPEAARGGRSNQRSDVFQLGMIVSEIMTGERLRWSADGSHLIVEEPAPGAGPVEGELAQLVAKCVDSDPEKRPASAVAVAGFLAAAEAARPPGPWMRLRGSARRLWRRHPRLLKLAGVAIGVAAVARTVQVVSRPPLCQGGAAQLAGVWDPARAEAVRRSFAATGTKYAASTFAGLRPALDSYAEAWKAMYSDACQATHIRGEQSTEVLDLRMSCLRRAQNELRSLTDLFTSAEVETVARSFRATAELTPIATCGDVAVLKAVVRPPADRATQARVEALRERVSELKALYGAGRYIEGARRGASLMADVRAAAYDPLTAEALHEYGMIQFRNHEEAEGVRSLDEAIVLAEASRHDRVLAESAVAKVMLLGSLGRDETLRQVVPWTEAVVKRVGGDRRLESWLYNAIADDDRVSGRKPEALALYRRALDIKRGYLGPDHWDVALSVGNVANVLQEMGRSEEALRENERAVATLEKVQHPDLPLHVYNRGEIRLSLGQPRDALQDFERALRLWLEDLPDNHPYVAYALTGVGLARLELGESGEGVVAPLERALAIREGAAGRTEDQAVTEFALARALWAVGRGEAAGAAGQSTSQERARELARRAREHFGSARPADQARIDATVEDWQKSARPRGASPPPAHASLTATTPKDRSGLGASGAIAGRP